MNKKYVWSVDGKDFFSERYNSIRECIESVKEFDIVDYIYVGELEARDKTTERKLKKLDYYDIVNIKKYNVY